MRRALWCIVLSGLLVPAFFPSPTFDTGLDLGRTLVLALRNGLLVYALWCLWKTALQATGLRRQVREVARRPKPEARSPKPEA